MMQDPLPPSQHAESLGVAVTQLHPPARHSPRLQWDLIAWTLEHPQAPSRFDVGVCYDPRVR
jgi:hypothetical protein